MDFANTSERYAVEYEIVIDGATVISGIWDKPNIPAHGQTTFEIDLGDALPADAYVQLNLYTYTTASTEVVPEGLMIGNEQLIVADGRNNEEARENLGRMIDAALAEQVRAVEPAALESDSAAPLNVRETDREIIVNGTGFTYRYNKEKAAFTSLIRHGYEMLEKPTEYNIWRAPTDNDMYIKTEWMQAGYNVAETRVYKTSVAVENDGAVAAISSTLALLPIYRQRILDAVAHYNINQDGQIEVQIDATRDNQAPWKEEEVYTFLPRFGLRFFLKPEYDKLSYFGYGPFESYIDKHHASLQGIYAGEVAAEHEDYIKPQENGSHFGVHQLALGGAYGELPQIRVTADPDSPHDGFSFNVSEYTQEELESKKHNFELEKSGMTVLCIDYRNSGVGSNSCGPALQEQYRFNEREFSFRFTLDLF